MQEGNMLMYAQLLQELQETLLREIPITRYLGLHVDDYRNNRLILSAPLAANINHKQSVFAGSLNAVASLAGWGRLWLLLKEYGIPGEIAIQDSTSNYIHPVKNDFTAICQPLSTEQEQQIATALEKHGKARVELNAEICSGDTTAMTFKGRYVVLRDLRQPYGTLV